MAYGKVCDMEIYQDWIDYYRRKGATEANPAKISGYDHGLAQLTERGLADLTSKITNLLSLHPVDRVLDVGCGTGLITNQLVSKTTSLFGIDANYEMIKHASEKITRVVAAADRLPFANSLFNKVLCHSIIQYFPSHECTAQAIQEMIRVLQKPGLCLIMDVPDIERKEEYLRAKTPDAHNLQRLFYDRRWFSDLFPGSQIFDLEIADYLNSRYRFSVLIQR